MTYGIRFVCYWQGRLGIQPVVWWRATGWVQ